MYQNICEEWSLCTALLCHFESWLLWSVFLLVVDILHLCSINKVTSHFSTHDSASYHIVKELNLPQRLKEIWIFCPTQEHIVLLTSLSEEPWRLQCMASPSIVFLKQHNLPRVQNENKLRQRVLTVFVEASTAKIIA